MRRSALLLIALVACAAPSRSVANAPSSPEAGARSEALTRARRLALADTIRQSLHDELLAAWYPRAIDREQGGFLSQWEFDWKPSGPQDKMIVTQARHVWTTARASQVFPSDTV